jgi:uncharacterized membrane protein YhhN
VQRPSRSARLKFGYVALAATDAWLAGSTRSSAHLARRLTKPLLMPVLAASLVTSARAKRSPLRATTLTAQAFGWGGDVALMGEGDDAFLVGSGSFALGHAAYILGFQRNRTGGSSILDEPRTRALVAIWAGSAPVLAWGAARKDPRLGMAVAGYSAILTAMVATASRLDDDLPKSARRLAALGAGLFMVSDTILGTRTFLLRSSPERLETVVMATYTTAQLLLSEAAARAGGQVEYRQVSK